ncbi:MAG: general secretion pathway protein GspK, partial [Pseudomonadota bacterium]
LGQVEGERLAAVIADWIDPDNFTEVGGAEDGVYSALPIPYSTPGRPIADISELRAMSGVTRLTYTQLARYLCARPGNEPHQINANLLTEADAPLLVAVLGGRIAIDEAVEIIRSRPPVGYPGLEQFWANPLITGVFDNQTVPSDIRGRLSLNSQFFEARAEISRNGLTFETTLLLQVGNGRAVTLARRYGRPT